MNRLPGARLDDRLGPLEPPYRSRGEAQVGRLLDRYGIPFVYEQPTHVWVAGARRTWHPDFTLLSYADLVLEFAGLIDRPAYCRTLAFKRRIYTANDIGAMFVYPADLHGPRWPERLFARVDGTGRRYRADTPRTFYRRR